ncbi:MAG: SPFH domain-containing protein [Eubacteriaceae bacterium]|nr:SPFH domain-containing protein [Eubacteriaceae bacterium]
MGLIKAGLGAVGGTLADQWLDFFVCESMGAETLMVKGEKRVSGRSSNTKGNDNIISNGSGIIVADGQCMIIVEQGKVVEVCAEPGEYTYDTSTEPSIFYGTLSENIKATFQTIGKRFAFGGDTAKDQRVYYFNTKELTNNKFGTPNPVPFNIVSEKIGFELQLSVRCSGVYSYRIDDPLLFYTNVASNVEYEYTREMIDTQLKAEFISALQAGLAKLSAIGLLPSELIAHNEELEESMNAALSEKWGNLRGLKVVSIALSSVTLPEEDAALLRQAQQSVFYSDAGRAAGLTATATAQAMQDAAKNEGGAMAGFMGVGMAQNVGGANMTNLFNIAQQQQQQNASAAPVQNANTWKCSCGAENTGKFCTECGEKKPEPAGTWTCAKCGSVNTGKFCPECGEKKPESGKWICSCGTENEGNFCSNCGNKRS